jgi:colanic acid biosynthesis glycosyl transferase WcaI
VSRERKTIVIISQVYVPDPAATGQHLADVAEELVRRGNKVIVYTSSRGYDEPSIKYPLRETINGVLVRRVPLSSFGKSSILVRLAGGFSFVAQSVVRAIASRKIDAVLISTSPPLAPVAALTLGALRGAKVKYWVMDINPDQIVALGMASPTSTSVRAFDWLNRRILSRANNVVVLDRLMAARINAKVPVGARLSVLPPWPAEDPLDVVQHEENPFRREHVPPGKLVLMYSGNHGPSNPLTTILQAAKRLENDDRLLFMFVGGGVGKKEVDETTSSNIVSLPYQPMAELRNSLSAADVHIVTVGDAVAGIVHPSKVYGAMAVGRPILLVGPPENHVADILAEHDIGWHVQHGDVDGAVRVLLDIASMPRSDLVAKGMLARSVMTSRGGKAGSVARMADVVEE